MPVIAPAPGTNENQFIETLPSKTVLYSVNVLRKLLDYEERYLYSLLVINYVLY